MERKLLTIVLQSDILPQEPGQARNSDLGAPFDVGPEWRAVSHALALRPDNSALLSVLVEKQ